MLTDFREELMSLERENSELQSRFDGYSDVKEKSAGLREEEARLLQAKRDLDGAIRQPDLSSAQYTRTKKPRRGTNLPRSP
jgi:hypothetical protein